MCAPGKGPVISYMDGGTIYDRELFETLRRLADAGFFIEAQAAVAGQQGALLLSKKERMDGAV